MAFGSKWDTHFAFILIRNLYINLRGWCQIMSWERDWWGTESSTWKSITAWNRREKPTSGWWTLCSERKVSDLSVHFLRNYTGVFTSHTVDIIVTGVFLPSLFKKLELQRCLYKIIWFYLHCQLLQSTLNQRPRVEMFFLSYILCNKDWWWTKINVVRWILCLFILINKRGKWLQ